MITRYWKLFILFALAGFTVFLSTIVVSLQFFYARKLRKLRRVEREKSRLKDKTSAGTSVNSKINFKESLRSIKVNPSKTIRKSFPVDPLTELKLHHKVAPSTENHQTAADAHLGEALRIIPFEMEGGRELKGNALPPPLLYGEVGEGRGTNVVRHSWDKKAFQQLGGKTGTENIGSKNAKDAVTRRRRGGIVRILREILAGKGRRSAMKLPDAEHQSGSLSDRYQIEKEAIFHLEKAAEMGNSYAQNMIANVLASGIMPVTNTIELRAGRGDTGLHINSDFTAGGDQLARALMLWHLSAMDGNIEAAMALGYRHRFSAEVGTTLQNTKMMSDESLIDSYIGSSSPLHSSSLSHSSAPSAHYGVLGTCESALAYYEAAVDGIMDEIESSPLRGKVAPAIDQHRLAEIFQRGTSSAQSYNNKPDEKDEAMTYFKMRASLKNPHPDVHAAYKLATMFHYGLKGVQQDMKQALEYYTIAADHGSWEAAGQAGKFHVWGMGLEEEERDLNKAYKYFDQGAPGGLDSCQYRFTKKMQNKIKEAEQDSDDEATSDIALCDHPAVNGMGLLHVFGVPKTSVPVNITMAQEYFILARDMGNMDAYFNLAMLHLGWMNPEYGEILSNRKTNRSGSGKSPSKKDFRTAITYLDRAAKKGHFQARYHLAKIYARGITLKKKDGSLEGEVVVQSSCTIALKLYQEIADSGTTISRRMRVAYKQYTAADYESSLRNYIAAAETGSMDAQVNAAFLLEQGHCLGMSSSPCLKASLRMWKAAARQGNEEACLRVGDFYYYNRVDASTETKHANIYSIATFPYIRYVLYPENLFQLINKSMIVGIRRIFGNIDSITENEAEIEIENSSMCSAKADVDDTCSRPQAASPKNEEHEKKRLKLAAKYYRKAAEEHASERANFNLGFMHEYGLGLTQDFPLAKRHYDLAAAGDSGDGIFAVQIALTCMNVHENVLKLSLYLEKGLFDLLSSNSGLDAMNAGQPQQTPRNEGKLVATRRSHASRAFGVIVSHVFSWESLIMLALFFVLKKIFIHRQNRIQD